MKDASPPAADLEELVGLFYESAELLGEFAVVSADAMPRLYQRLLAHNNHMTVTVEAFHHSPVDVRVLDKRVSGEHYARKILLARQSDGRVVQFGIMRVNVAYLGDEVRREIESEQVPLGRVLISHNVLREVELKTLWQIKPGEELRSLLSLQPDQTVYGRTALIHVGGEPAVELLEIVAV